MWEEVKEYWWWWWRWYVDVDDEDDVDDDDVDDYDGYDDDGDTDYFPSASSSSVPQFVKSDPRFFLSFDCFAMEFFSIQERVSSLTFQYILLSTLQQKN